jgi:hypothetical protein
MPVSSFLFVSHSHSHSSSKDPFFFFHCKIVNVSWLQSFWALAQWFKFCLVTGNERKTWRRKGNIKRRGSRYWFGCFSYSYLMGFNFFFFFCKGLTMTLFAGWPKISLLFKSILLFYSSLAVCWHINAYIMKT